MSSQLHQSLQFHPFASAVLRQGHKYVCYNSVIFRLGNGGKTVQVSSCVTVFLLAAKSLLETLPVPQQGVSRSGSWLLQAEMLAVKCFCV